MYLVMENAILVCAIWEEGNDEGTNERKRRVN